MVVGIGQNVLLGTKERAVKVTREAMKNKVSTVENAVKFFAENKNKGVLSTPTCTLPNGTKYWYTNYGSGEIHKFVKKPNGVVLDSRYYPLSKNSKNYPVSVLETAPNGTKIMHTGFTNNKVTSNLTLPNGDELGRVATKDGVKYYRYIDHGLTESVTSQADKKAIYDLHALEARKGYNSVNINQ